MTRKISKKIIVNKFGGGIMLPEYIVIAKERIREQIKKGYKPIVVVSALNGVTDKLVSFFSTLKKKSKEDQKENATDDKRIAALINSFVENVKKEHIKMMRKAGMGKKEREKATPVFDKTLQQLKDDLSVVTRFGGIEVIEDKILSFGEKLSALFFNLFLNANNIKAEVFLAEDMPIITDNVRLNANINYEESARNIKKALRNVIDSPSSFLPLKRGGGLRRGVVPVINGFVGRDKEGNITTLGRGGTDTTACFIGAALKADKVILWKDTEGVLSGDPRIISNTGTVSYLSYEEAREAGKIVHDKAIRYVKDFKVPMEVVSISNPKKYTVVGSSGAKVSPRFASCGEAGRGAKIIGYKKGLTLLVVTDDKMTEYGFLYGIAKVFSSYQVNMVLIRNTRDSLHIVVEEKNGNLSKALQALKEKKYLIERWPVSMVTLIGSLDWDMVNVFNDVLFNICSNPQLGAFPYKHCVRLEAIVKDSEMKKVMRELYKVFIEKKQ